MASLKMGSHLRSQEFLFDPTYHPLNHGSYGAYPKVVRDKQRQLQDQIEARSDPSIRHTIPKLLHESREAAAPLLGASTEEVVLIANATTGINTVLGNLAYETGDIILYFSTAYGACEKAVMHICETTEAESVKIDVNFPIEDDSLISLFHETVQRLSTKQKHVAVAMFDTIATMPGVRLPWERLTTACHELGILSLIDGAHGIGHIDLTHLGELSPDFFTSNCYKWLYTPRPCAILYVPTRNQHLIRTTLPTSRGFNCLPSTSTEPSQSMSPDPFGDLFCWSATIDQTPYLCIPSALKFRSQLGGEDQIRAYCFNLARKAGKLMADMLGTEVMDNKTGTLSECCFTMVRLPLTFAWEDMIGTETTEKRMLTAEDGPRIAKWMMEKLMNEHDTWIPAKFYGGAIWVRLSAQTYLDLGDFEWAAKVLDELCQDVINRNGAGL